MYQGLTSKYRVIAAPNSMKGSVDAFLFSSIIEEAFHAVSDQFEVIQMPVADGGDLTCEILGRAMGLEKQMIEVHDPLGKKIMTSYRLGNGIAVMEMADASGMKLLKPKDLNPLMTSCAGTGEMIRDAVLRGATRLLLGVGGSATIDGGMGLLEGVGVVFYDREQKRLHASGESVGRIAEWDDSVLSIMKGVEIKVICDVENPLLGSAGAVQVFGRQKGATNEMMPVLEQNLKYFSDLIFQKKGKDLSQIEGMGAAGGINLALVGFLDAKIVRGADFVLDSIGFDQALEKASLVVTGEGKIDHQTLANKAPYAVYKRAKQKDIPVYAIGGSVTPNADLLFDKTYSLMNDKVDLNTAITHAGELIFLQAKQAATDFLLSRES
jgi:glycerate kinase